MGRAPDQTLQDHFAAIAAADPERVAADYTDDAMMFTPDGVLHGRAAVQEAFVGIFSALPNAVLSPGTVLVEDDVAFVTWTAESDGGRVDDGVDSFVFADDGLIRVQTIRFAITPT
ncbi:nuclear transport factor 2 family protein [Salsipaludibacter albus]|uniref:nuclear transport factor 2 family protein n=1 Tax=Salsipaludibacter albus TaxID=2849650 RepID=UPI001EE3EB53|nr:nuclear transport factor 2 family protein [Salsipaludibacter albus]MBY5163483.1 nuclear transport factor 2 family protein [Salsipaludibacter albus]